MRNASQDVSELPLSQDNAFNKRPGIQKFELKMQDRFRQERGKGLVRMDKLLNLKPGKAFPKNLDIIIDYEVDEILDNGLIYRETYHPSKEG